MRHVDIHKANTQTTALRIPSISIWVTLHGLHLFIGSTDKDLILLLLIIIIITDDIRV